MGFGHRVYKNFDPRAQILKTAVRQGARASWGSTTRCWTSPRELEEAALNDPYFVERKLYPNVDFYSGIIMRAIGIPMNMFTVMFAIGRMPGWIANWREVRENPESRDLPPAADLRGPDEAALRADRKALTGEEPIRGPARRGAPSCDAGPRPAPVASPSCRPR